MNDRQKKKNFSFSRRFPFMKSKDQSGSGEEVSCDERMYMIRIINNQNVIICHRIGSVSTL